MTGMHGGEREPEFMNSLKPHLVERGSVCCKGLSGGLIDTLSSYHTHSIHLPRFLPKYHVTPGLCAGTVSHPFRRKEDAAYYSEKDLLGRLFCMTGKAGSETPFSPLSSFFTIRESLGVGRGKTGRIRGES